MFTIKAGKDNVPYIKIVAYRDGYRLRFRWERENDEDCTDWVAEIDADEAVKEEFLEDIECEKESAEHDGIPVYSLRTVTNPEKLERLEKLNQTDVFVILKKDEERYLKM